MISPLLANVVLHRLDRVWHQRHRRVGVLVRYADDLVVLSPTKEGAEAAIAALRAILAGLGLELSEAKTRLVNLQQPGEGFDFLGFHHRWVESHARKGRYFCARWPSDRAVREARQRVRASTDRRRRLLPVATVVQDLNLFLRGWGNYFRFGNSTTVFHDLDWYVRRRVARLISKKHGRSGEGYGLLLLPIHGYFGLHRLVGSVWNGPVHAAR